jgi:hypothetical protein
MSMIFKGWGWLLTPCSSCDNPECQWRKMDTNVEQTTNLEEETSSDGEKKRERR